MLGMLCSIDRDGGKLLVRRVCGGVDRMESGVSGVGGEYADCDTAGTWCAVVTPPDTGRKEEREEEFRDKTNVFILKELR